VVSRERDEIEEILLIRAPELVRAFTFRTSPVLGRYDDVTAIGKRQKVQQRCFPNGPEMSVAAARVNDHRARRVDTARRDDVAADPQPAAHVGHLPAATVRDRLLQPFVFLPREDGSRGPPLELAPETRPLVLLAQERPEFREPLVVLPNCRHRLSAFSHRAQVASNA
jgi:hypothetical protein